jgi:hypothetical protein
VIADCRFQIAEAGRIVDCRLLSVECGRHSSVQ